MSVGAAPHQTLASSPISRIGALWVSHPTEMRSTPVSAIAGAVSRLTRPDASLIARPPIILTARRKIVERHVVEQHGVDARAQRLFELGKRVDLDLDLDEMPDMAAHAPDRLGDAAGDGDMIVLDERRIVEAEAMVDPAARPHRVFLERTQERRRLARAHDARLGMRDRRDEPRGRAGDAAEPAHEIERHALGRQHASRGPLDRRHLCAARDARAVGDDRGEADRRVHEAKGERGCVEAGDDACLSRRHHGLGDAIGGRDGVGGDVAGAAEVLDERLADDRLDEQGGQMA